MSKKILISISLKNNFLHKFINKIIYAYIWCDEEKCQEKEVDQ